VICPECGGEYREGIYRCPECEVELVTPERYEQLNADPERDDSPAVTVFEAADIGTIELARSILEEAGIGCSIKNERMLGLFPAFSGEASMPPRFRTAEIQVTERNELRARRLLEPLLAGDVDLELPADVDVPDDESTS